MVFRRLMYYSPDDGGNGGGSGDGDEGNPAQKALEGLLSRMGDANKVALHLLDENYRYRQTIRELKGKLPAEGTVSVTQADADLLARYRELGDPESLSTLRTQLESAERNRVLAEAAQAYGFKTNVLSKLISDEKVELREETVDGVNKPYAVVIKGDKSVRLDEYAKSEWADFLPSLTEGGSSDVSKAQQFTRQARGKGPASGADLVSARIEQMAEARKNRKNPLVSQ